MYFDYIAHPISQDLLQIIEKNPSAFISVFFEANYADDFDEIVDDCGEEIEQMGMGAAKQVYAFTQEVLDNTQKTLEMDGQNWMLPLHFFLSGEFSEDAGWQQAKPNFLSKKEGDFLRVNALLHGHIIKMEHQNMLLTPCSDLPEIISGLVQILEGDLGQRWQFFTKNAGQYLDTFEQEEDRDDFIDDLEEFISSILLPFLKLCVKEKKHMLVFID